jgi:hypothetical protein
MIKSLITALREVCVEKPDNELADSLWFEPTAEELADAVWLATQIGLSTARQIESIKTIANYSVSQQEHVSAPQLISDTDETEFAAKSESDETELAEKTEHLLSTQLTHEESQPTEKTDLQQRSGQPQHFQDFKSGHLYTTTTKTIHKNKSQQIRGRAFRTPAATMLPDALSIERALRPLRYRVESPINLILDEEATVQRIAEEQVWWPVLQGEPERWFEVALVVDQSPSMVIWQQTIAELRDLFERHGAFRHVRTWGIVTKENGLFAGTGATLNYSRPCSPHELIDPIGRRLFIVVTDCMSPAWHNGEMIKWLERWGQGNPVAMLQMLPRRLWAGSALREATKVSLHASAAGLPNSQLKIDTSDFWFDDEIPTGIKVPVLTLEPKPLAGWANMLMGKAWTSGVVFQASADYKDKPLPTSTKTTELSAAQRLKRFYATASPTAQKLAAYLAAAPLTLPVMRLVQQVMLPKSRQLHFAEVFLGGLLRQTSPSQESNPMLIQYDFHEGIRDLLLDSLLMSESIQVLKKVSAFIEQRLGQSFDFQALLADPTAVDGIEINKDNQRFAEIGGKILRRLGGEYTSLAEQLENGKLATRNPLRYTDNRDGTVTDNKTGLIWLKNANWFGRQNWEKAMQSAANLAHGQCGLSDGSKPGDWRLPTRNEWNAMVDNKYRWPALSNAAGTEPWKEGDAFSGVPAGRYWSSTPSANATGSAWYVGIGYGNVSTYGKTYTYFVWPVRRSADEAPNPERVEYE